MPKKILLIVILALGFAGTALAHHLSEENWITMSPTVQVTSYQWQFAGSVSGISSGSGTVISPDGLVLTNHHVIFDEVRQKPLDAFGICITFDMAKEPLCHYTAQLVANDKDLDVAILKINPKDIFGKALPPFKTLNYESAPAPKEKQEVQVVGYPASGGETITISKGQISGADTFNGYQYFKTDTDFDHGSSGGTVLDAQGRFIGVPTYIRSYAENVGYFLDLREALSWIKKNLKATPAQHPKAEQELMREMKRFSKANQTLEYTSGLYPYFQVSLPEGWHFFEISDSTLVAGQKNVQDGVNLNLRIEHYPFEIDAGYMKRLDEEFIERRKIFPDFKKELVTFAGQKTVRITYTAYNQKIAVFYIPYGHTLIGLSYAINLDHEARQVAALRPVLDSFKLLEPKRNDPGLPETVEYEEPPFKINKAGNFRLQKPMGSGVGDRLIRGTQQNNYDAEFLVDYNFVPRDERELPAAEKLKEEIKRIAEKNSKLISKKETVILDGLRGYFYSFEYEGDLYQQIRKRLVMKLEHGEYEFKIQYDDLSQNFDQNLPLIESMLKSFQSGGGAGTPQTNFGTLGTRFKDIQYHRFAAEISELADKNILEGYDDGTFRPEFLARKADALKIMLLSKNEVEKEQGLGKEVNFERYAGQDPHIRWFTHYKNYANRKRTFSAEARFEPYVAITLAEAVTWLTKIYEIPVWQGQTAAWYKRFMDKAYELGWIPAGLEGPDVKLTRAELSAIVHAVYTQAK